MPPLHDSGGRSRRAAVEHFLDDIENQGTSKKSRRNLMGLGVDLGEEISAEDIDEARREMLGSFPRTDI